MFEQLLQHLDEKALSNVLVAIDRSRTSCRLRMNSADAYIARQYFNYDIELTELYIRVNEEFEFLTSER